MNKILFLICLICLALLSPVNGQTVYRWINIPNNGPCSFEKDELSKSSQQNLKFKLIYEHVPGKVMRRNLKKFFPELQKEEPESTPPEKEIEIDVDKATIILEELKREGEETLDTASKTKSIPNASEPISLF